MDGLRRFIEAGNHSAVDVGDLRRGTRSLSVKNHSSEATIREGADELTLRADEVETLKALINIDHVEHDRWGAPLVDADWHAFCQAIHKRN